MDVNERQLLEDATSRLNEVASEVDGEDEELAEELELVVSDMKTAVNSLDFSSGRSVAEEEAETAVESLHDCIVEYSESWEDYPDLREEIDEEIIPDIERAVEELSQTDYEDYRQDLDDQFGGLDIDEDPDDRL